ncbi:desert hedgehog protein isoform X1 [Hippocampus comes]|uniref:desert hedgehog protein isoform X1 n=1 Tax=Hippocampus comes TaxID=109280 RepID=UPI00094F138D|nr:PREDICTED: desert hedgehog protein isoform X1 [Hippocampus comes]
MLKLPVFWNGPSCDPSLHVSHLKHQASPMKQPRWARSTRLGLLALWTCLCLAEGCGPGPGYGVRSRPRKLTPMHYKQLFPNFSENNLGASGRAEGKITRNSERFNELVCNYNPDIVFKDEENTNADRFMTKRCKECLNRLAIAVMNQWPGVHLRVTEAWDEDGHHPAGSLHYEGRAVDITTDDRDTDKYGLLAQLAVEAGFDWVHYESKYHIHCSVKADHSVAVEKGGCFPGWARVTLAGGRQKSMSSLSPGDRVMAMSSTGQIVFSLVLFFLHRDQEAWVTVLSLETEDGHRLAVTAQHLVFLDPDCTLNNSKYQARFASRARARHCILIHRADGQISPSRISSISVQRTTGVYAPLTEDGTLFVDGVLVSSYALVEGHMLAHWAFGPVRLISSFQHRLWGESTTQEQTTCINTTAFHHNTDFYVSKSSPITYEDVDGARRMKVKEGLNRQTSNVHWYARVLYRVGSIILDSNSFHP